MAQARRWIFTLNNPQENEHATLELGGHARAAVWQLERGLNGTLHIQGYVEFSRPMRLTAVRGVLPRAHWEQARGNAQQCADYASKDDTRVDGPWKLGKIGGESGKRSDLEVVAQAVLQDGAKPSDVARDHGRSFIMYHKGIQALWASSLLPRLLDSQATATFVFGPTGTGKSRLLGDTLGRTAYWKDNSKWWDDYRGETTVLWDDFRGGSASFSTMLRLVDRYPIRVEYKGGSVQLQAKDWVFTSNKAPWGLWKITDQDPWFRRITTVIYKDLDCVRIWDGENCVFRAKGDMPFYNVQEEE